jgi:hypothetical protein
MNRSTPRYRWRRTRSYATPGPEPAAEQESGSATAGRSTPGQEGQATPTDIGLEVTRRIVDAGAQLVEVLPPREYEQEHLSGAINIPLKALNANSAAQLDKDRPVVVYCWDDR